MEGGYFSEWLTSYRDYLRMRNYSSRTLASYDQVIRHFGYYVWIRRNVDPSRVTQYWNDFSAVRLDTDVDVPPAMITEFLGFLLSLRAYKPTTLHRVISTLSSYYRYLTTQGALASNPMIGVVRPKIKEKELLYLKHNQVMKLIESIPDDKDRLIIRLIYATGVRVSELCAINIEDIDMEDHTIRVKGKGGKIRTVFVDGDTLATIDRYAVNRIMGPLFIGQQGKHISPRTIEHIFRKYAPPGITPHKIRHSYASELYRRSKNLRVVQENLGHASIKTTEIYLHTDLDERRQVYRDFFPLERKTEE
jgi:site-specific recombinase XerD